MNLKSTIIACFIVFNTTLCLPQYDVRDKQTPQTQNDSKTTENVTTPLNQVIPVTFANKTFYSNVITPNHTFVNHAVEDTVILEENENRYDLHSVANLDPLNDTLSGHYVKKKFKPEGFPETTPTTTESNARGGCVTVFVNVKNTVKNPVVVLDMNSLFNRLHGAVLNKVDSLSTVNDTIFFLYENKGLKGNSTEAIRRQTLFLNDTYIPTTKIYRLNQNDKEPTSTTDFSFSPTESTLLRDKIPTTHKIATTNTAANPNENTIRLTVIHKKRKKQHNKKHKIILNQNVNYHLLLEKQNTKPDDFTYVPTTDYDYERTTENPIFTNDRFNMILQTSDYTTVINRETFEPTINNLEMTVKKKRKKNKNIFEKNKLKQKKFTPLTTFSTETNSPLTTKSETKCLFAESTDTTTETRSFEITSADPCAQQTESTTAKPPITVSTYSPILRRKQNHRTKPYKTRVSKVTTTTPSPPVHTTTFSSSTTCTTIYTDTSGSPSSTEIIVDADLSTTKFPFTLPEKRRNKINLINKTKKVAKDKKDPLVKLRTQIGKTTKKPKKRKKHKQLFSDVSVPTTPLVIRVDCSNSTSSTTIATTPPKPVSTTTNRVINRLTRLTTYRVRNRLNEVTNSVTNRLTGVTNRDTNRLTEVTNKINCYNFSTTLPPFKIRHKSFNEVDSNDEDDIFRLRMLDTNVDTVSEMGPRDNTTDTAASDLLRRYYKEWTLYDDYNCAFSTNPVNHFNLLIIVVCAHTVCLSVINKTLF